MMKCQPNKPLMTACYAIPSHNRPYMVDGVVVGGKTRLEMPLSIKQVRRALWAGHKVKLVNHRFEVICTD